MSRAQSNPRSRFQSTEIDWEEPPPPARLQLIEDASQSILAHNDSPDVGFSWSVNPYRGCTHACAYCYARNFHEYLGYGAGTDHDTKIVYKPQAAALLAAEFARPRWKGELVAFSGVTDCYQAVERRLGLTRACLQVCLDHHNPVGIITRSPLVTRDLDLLVALHARAAVRVNLSIPLLDAGLARALEPGAPPPALRLQAIRRLTEAGVPVGVSLGPVIPGLSDRAIPETLTAAREAGASWAWMILVRLAGSVAGVFEARLREALPLQADTVMARIRRARGGLLNNPNFGERMAGDGEAWAITEQLFARWKARLGFTAPPDLPDPSPFRRPGEARQLRLF